MRTFLDGSLETGRGVLSLVADMMAKIAIFLTSGEVGDQRHKDQARTRDEE